MPSNGVMTTTLRISEPSELLSYLPYHLGFQPQESVVALAVRGQRRRVGLLLRIDISDLLHPEAGEERRKILRSHMEADGAHALILVTYTNSDFSPTGTSPTAYSQLQLRQLLTDLERQFDDDLPVLSSWVITPDHYFQLQDGAVPPRDMWSDAAELVNTATVASAVYAGAMVVPDRAALADIPRAEAKDRDRAQRATLRWLERNRADGEKTWRIESWQLWEDAIAAQMQAQASPAHESPEAAPLVADPLLLGRLQAGLENIRIRDAVMVSCLPGMGDLPYRSVATDAREEVARSVDRVLNSKHAARPGAEVRAVEQLLSGIYAHCAAARSTPALTVLAWISWWRGNGARASVLIDRALEADPSYNMARLVERMIEVGMPPGWVQRQRELEEVG